MQVCLAEYQTAGKGRRGRHWLAPYAGSINLSVAWNFPHGSGRLRGFSLATGVCVARALREYGVSEIGLKWPNDIFWRDRKVGGILIEVAGEADGNCRVISGIGLNIHLSQQYQDAIDQPCIGLADIIETPVDRNVLVAGILEQLAVLHAEFPQRGLAPYLPDWNRLDICRDRQVDIQLGTDTVSGLATGINDEGQFLLLTGEGVSKFDVGDISLRMPAGIEP
jgi:BirA family biotin operon repressor/biotin-[acetyl-CoA-carboxylase] ligase